MTRLGASLRRSAEADHDPHTALEQIERSTDPDAAIPGLVRDAKGGDELAFAELYIRLFDPVHRYLSVALRNYHDAQEVAQEAFARAFKALHLYDPARGAFRDWLFRLVRNLAIDHLRKGARTHETDLSALPGSALPVADRAASVLDRLDPDAGLRSMIDELPDAQRRVLTLRFLFSFSTAEIADVTGASAANVRQIQHRALKAMASSLAAATPVAA